MKLSGPEAGITGGASFAVHLLVEHLVEYLKVNFWVDELRGEPVMRSLLFVSVATFSMVCFADEKFESLKRKAVEVPRLTTEIMAPWFDTCKSGTEFDQRRCKQSLPGRMAENKKTVWLLHASAVGIISISPYDFGGKVFRVVAGHVAFGAEAGGYLSSKAVPFIKGIGPLKTWNVRMPDDQLAEAWRASNSAVANLRVDIIFSLGNPWSSSFTKGYGWDPRKRKRVPVTGHSRGILINVLAIEVVNQQTGQVITDPVPVAKQPSPAEKRAAHRAWELETKRMAAAIAILDAKVDDKTCVSRAMYQCGPNDELCDDKNKAATFAAASRREESEDGTKDAKGPPAEARQDEINDGAAQVKDGAEGLDQDQDQDQDQEWAAESTTCTCPVRGCTKLVSTWEGTADEGPKTTSWYFPDVETIKKLVPLNWKCPKVQEAGCTYSVECDPSGLSTGDGCWPECSYSIVKDGDEWALVVRCRYLG